MCKEVCRFCHSELKHTFVNLRMSPPSNSYIKLEDADKGQMNYPLNVHVCDKCFLVQLGEFESPQNIFSDYTYFSSYSSSWLEHAKKYVYDMIDNFNINENSQVIEIASNDGYLLQYFKAEHIPVLGIEPAKNIAEIARNEKQIPTISEFFGTNLAEKLRLEGMTADLLLGNNVLAHVPDINDFVEGMQILLDDDGMITMEFPHLLRLIEHNQFDTIYHEHFSYLSFLTVQKIFSSHGLRLFNVEEFPTHGGSLRIFACHEKSLKYETQNSVFKMIEQEKSFGIDKIETYLKFNDRIKKLKYDILDVLIKIKRQGKSIAAYGAAAKGNTLLNYCGIGSEFIDYTVDKNPHKQNTLLPGSMISVYSPDKILETKPNYIVIMPWNLKSEIVKQLEYVRSWGAEFITFIPEVKIF